MKKFVNLSINKQTAIIINNDKLRKMFLDYIAATGNDYILDICNMLRGCDYAIGFYNRNYIYVRDALEFMEAADNIIQNFGGSEAMTRIYSTCEKLWNVNSNLFRHTVDKLAGAILDYLNNICEYVEHLQYKIDKGNNGDDIRDRVECFADFCLRDAYVTDDGRVIRLETLR